MKKLFLVLILLFTNIPPVLALEINQISPKLAETTEMINNSVVGEQVKDFRVDIALNTDGSFDVKETLQYYFDTDRHGIYRNIPFTLVDNGTRYDMDFDFEDVVDEKGKKYKADIYKEGEQWVLKIGDPDKTITGDHTYVISYKVRGALRYFETHDELYWNITGNGWEIPIRKARTVITIPSQVKEKDIKIQCFTGTYGSSDTNCIGSSNGPTAQFETTKFLNSYEGLTVAYGFPKGIVAELKPEKYVPFFERWYGKVTLAGIIIAAVSWYILLPIYLVFRWFTKGRDPFVGIPVTATFNPPKIGKRNLTPAEAGALLDEHVDKRDLFATIIDLARRGHLKISELKEKEFYLTKTVPKKKDPLLPFEQTLYNGVFAIGDNVKLKDVKFYTTASRVETELYNLMVEHKYFPKNPRTTRNIYYGLGAAGMFTFNWVLAFISFTFGRFMPRKTLHGAETASQVQGLKNFLTSQEKQLNFQGDKQMLFEKLLPFASAFGVEKAWAERFKDINLKNPDWYEGSSGSTFRSAVFASHLSNSYNSFAASSTPPSSSSGSGFSGGSSGGGGGGGGGGSW